MSTKFAEPKTDKFTNTEGFIFPDYSGKEFETDPLKNKNFLDEMLAPGYSFEAQQGIFGQYRHFYSLKFNNNYFRSCLKMCINQESLTTSNLSQEDKLCARECIILSEKYIEGTDKMMRKLSVKSSVLPQDLQRAANI
jgi:hypothetical protein